MPSRSPSPRSRLSSLLGAVEDLNRIERTTILVAVGIGVVIGIVTTVASPPDDLGSALFEIAVTALFAIFLWSPLAATLLLGAAMTMSFVVDLADVTLLAFSIAAGCVTRTGTAALVVGYGSAFIVAAAAVGQGPVSAPGGVVGYVLIAAAVGGIGLVVRAAHARGRRLNDALESTARREREAIIADRQRLAGELHDSIAHDLTIIALHSQLLDDADDQVRRDSGETIRRTAVHALRDLRHVIETAADAPVVSVPAPESLADAFDQARTTLESVGHHVDIAGHPRSSLPRTVEVELARVLRECVTNVLKHAASGPVRIELDVADAGARLVVTNALDATRRRDLPSGGTGVARMSERVRDLGGSLTAEAHGEQWRVNATLPLASAS